MAQDSFLHHRCKSLSTYYPSNVRFGILKCSCIAQHCACCKFKLLLIQDTSDFPLQVGARGRQLQYDGHWVRGKQEGSGTSHYYNGETYQGE